MSCPPERRSTAFLVVRDGVDDVALRCGDDDGERIGDVRLMVRVVRARQARTWLARVEQKLAR